MTEHSGNGAPTSGTNAIWDVVAANPTYGFFALRFRGAISKPIPFDTTADDAVDIITASMPPIPAGALQAAPGAGSHTLAVDGTLSLMFVGPLGMQPVEAFTVAQSAVSVDVEANAAGVSPSPDGELGDTYVDEATGNGYTYAGSALTAGWKQTSPPTGSEGGAVDSVNSQTGDVVLDASDVGADAAGAATAAQAAAEAYADSIVGGGGVAWLHGEGPPTDGANAIWLLTGAPTTGTFTLTFRGDTTTALAFDATGDDVAAALVALASVGAGNVVAPDGTETNTLPDDGLMGFSFVEALGVQDIAALNVTDGTDGGLATSPAVPGVPTVPVAVIAQQYVDVLEPAGYELRPDGTWLKVWAPQQIRTGDGALTVDVGVTDGGAITYRAGQEEDDHSKKTQTPTSIYWEIEESEIERLEVDWTNQRRYETARDSDGTEVAFFAMQYFDTPTSNQPGISLGSSSATSVQFLSGTDDPTSVGKPAVISSLYARTGAGQLWLKTGAGDTEWSLLAFS